MTIKIPGFDKPDTTIKHRMILNIEGLEKQGKTHFALTAPGPLAFFDIDIGTEGVIHKFTTGKEIIVSEHKIPKDAASSEGFDFVAAWQEFYNRLQAVLKHPQVRTVVIDTMTEVWELLRMARFGRLSQVKSHHYGPVNAEMRELIREAYEYGKNFIMIHKMKPQYVDDQWNGKYDRAGFKDIGFLSQLSIELSFDEGEFTATCRDCRHDMSLCGMDLSGPMCNFPTLAQMVFPNSDAGDWS